MTTSIATLQEIGRKLRIHSITATTEAGSGHPTSCMSAADIMSVMFFREMQFDPSDPDNPANDRFVLSKGHAAPLLYAAFAEAGIFTVPQLATLRKIDSILEGHPTPEFPGSTSLLVHLGRVSPQLWETPLPHVWKKSRSTRMS